VTGEFHDVIWVVVFFNVGEAIFDGRKGAGQDHNCFHLGLCPVAGVMVADRHIGLEPLTPIEVGTRCEAGIKEPVPQFSRGNVAIRIPNLCSIITVTDSDTWVGVFFDLPSARLLDGRLAVRALRQVSVHKKALLSTISCNANLLLSVITYTLSSAGRRPTLCGSLFSVSTLSIKPLGLRSGASKANGNIKRAH